MSIAASVLAKTYRDDYMNRIHEEFPMYNWKQNKATQPKSTEKRLENMA
jgi:ribonuclease HII